VARIKISALVFLLVAALGAATRSATPRFFTDDPLWTDDDAALDASKVAAQEDTNGYDFIVNTFLKPGQRVQERARNVNTLDEVPDSSWFTNRIGRRDLSLADLVRGPDRGPSTVSLEKWVVSGGKGSGVQPGFRMMDPTGQTYQIEVDPPSNPEMASGAEIIGTAFYHAFGYYTVDVYLAELDADALVISEKATIRDPLNGKRRRMTRRDVNDVLRLSARQPNGKYRVLASRFAPGKPLGNFRYYGTRPDDPNDIVPHEHRRELRGARVFAAWLNHDDSRGVNSLDFLETRDGRGYIKHYMFDFGSILGSGTIGPQRERAGNEYIFESTPGWLTLATLGLYVRPWMLVDYPDVPRSIGRLESEAFDAVAWRPEYPNPAFHNMRPDDAFWGARIVARFSDEAVRAIVEKAKFSDPRATEYLTKTLIARRDKVLKAWLNDVNPVIDPVLDASGALTFGNAAVAARVAEPPSTYTLQWFRLDNAADKREPIGDAATTSTATGRLPSALASLRAGDYAGVTITAKHPTFAAWAKPATFYFRRSADGWTWVGAERE
jgi:hypothetical protein